MSLDDPTPTEYFGPHAKRWTNPDTGVTISLSPRDYYRAVAKEQLREEKKVEDRLREKELRQLAQLKSRTVSEKAVDAITAREEKLRDEAVSAAWNDEALDEGMVTIDRLGDPRAAPTAGLFKEKGVLIAPLGGWNQPEHQRYEVEVESSPIPPEMAGQFDAIVYGATRGGIKYPEQGPQMISANPGIGGAVVNAGRYRLTASTDEGDQALLARGEIRYMNVSADDSLGLIQLSTPTKNTVTRRKEETAGRHFKRRKITRNAVRQGLVYIIAVIGVAAVVIEAL